MDPGTLYDDDRVVLDRHGVTLRRYYFPLGRSRLIGYEQIQSIEQHPNSWLAVRGRLWGTGTPRYWLPLDLGRPWRRTLVVLDVGDRFRPAFTPKDPERVLEILRDHTRERVTGRA